ncbi:MAG: HAMP domain-containing histidine kinase, partial [Synechococcales cyanobacterium RU_4_20]|nr:HAMP domain-containing histidine kinase [Synechococcales cyanobacterium RU_4_20]
MSTPLSPLSLGWRRRDFCAIGFVLMMVIVLEFSTPVDYVMGYLYIGPLLFASGRLPHPGIWGLTILIALLTLLNLWLPNQAEITWPMLINRLIAALSLIVTAMLGERNAAYAQAIARQQAQLQAKMQLEGIRSDFIATLAHDLKTPVLGAISTVEAFIRGEFGGISNIQKQVLTTMERSHRTSLGLLETLLDVYHNDIQGLQLHLEPLDLTLLVEDMANQVAPIARDRQVQIIIRDAHSEFRRSLWVKADTLQLQRVLMNLLVNAINHSRRGDQVEVWLEPSGSQQCVKILDRGAGLKPEELSHLFQRFYQGKSDRQAQGSGLGLYLARQIITAHQGTIWAENQTPKGAIFGF